MRPTLLYIGRMLKRFFTCHPERSEGSHVFEKAGFFAALRITLKVKRFMTHYTSIANPSCQRFGLNWRKLCATIGYSGKPRSWMSSPQKTDSGPESSRRKRHSHGGETEVVSRGEVRNRLVAEGGLGALLRY
jgi:hypothetical protein